MVAESDGLREARTHRSALCSALLHWVGSSDDDPDPTLDGVTRLRAAALRSGEGRGAILDLYDDARAQPWRLDLEREAQRLSGCERGAVILREPMGTWRAAVCGCGSRLCPVCARARAARATARWRAVLDAASADGAVLTHWTLTQPAIAAEGGLVTPTEVRRYKWRGTLAQDGVVARAVGGESLGESYTRLRVALRELRQGRRTRAAWRRDLGAYILGTEWTGRGPGGVPRWHVHAHVLTCTLPRDGFSRSLTDRLNEWRKHVGGSIRAQHVRTVDASAVVEVLKYPFKPASLTSAQRIETMAYMRGLRPHHVGGAWHATSRDHREEPWSRWLAARPTPVRYPRLYLLPRDGSPAKLYTGLPNNGVQRWGVLRDDRSWHAWDGPAEPFAALLRTVDPDAPVLPEPGSDLELDDDDGD